MLELDGSNIKNKDKDNLQTLKLYNDFCITGFCF